MDPPLSLVVCEHWKLKPLDLEVAAAEDSRVSGSWSTINQGGLLSLRNGFSVYLDSEEFYQSFIVDLSGCLEGQIHLTQSLSL